MSTRFAKRSEQVKLIREAALAKLEKDGEFRKVEGFGPVQGWLNEEWSLLYRTPFQGGPTKIMLPNLPYGLDIWHRGPKVFSIEWETEEDPKVISMKRGDWEERFIRLLG